MNDFKGLADLDPKTKKMVDNVTDLKGRININGNIKNGGIYSNTDLKNLSFTYKSTDAVLKILSGSANMRGDTLYLSRVNSRLASMPVYLNGRVSNVLTNPKYPDSANNTDDVINRIIINNPLNTPFLGK